MRDGELLVVTDNYRTGWSILEQLRNLVRPARGDHSYQARRASRKAYQDISERLLAPIVQHEVDLEDAPRIGFLAQLYPNEKRFALPFAQLHNLHTAWKRHREGIYMPVLGHMLHPFYGTYVPSRTSHLELFGTWLSAYKGPRATAIDVGTGSGVLALMLCRHNFEKVLATDTNPNAIESVRRELKLLRGKPPVTPILTDLLGDDTAPVDLIVFNPPWMQGGQNDMLDSALYFTPGLFERFFDRAHARLSPDGRVVLLFSNVMSLVQPELPHPIERELEQGRFKLVQKLQRKVKATPTASGEKRKTREKVEVWELARV